MNAIPQQLLANQKTVITLLDVCGSCITDVMYNFLYDRAIAVHEKTGTGVTDAYRQVLAEYVKESSTPKFYSLLLNTMHHYVRISTIYQNISYPDCISLYAGLFVPHMYLGSLTSEQKLNILSMIIGNTVRAFVKEILAEHISCIIDDHQDPINVEILQDAVLKILMKERNDSYDKFIQSQNGNKKTKTKAKSAIVAPIQKKSLDKISGAFKKAVTDRANMRKKNNVLIKKNKTLIAQFNELKALFLKQLEVQKEQTKVIADLKEELIVISTSKPDPIITQDAETQSTSINLSLSNASEECVSDTDGYDDMFSVPVQYIDDHGA